VKTLTLGTKNQHKVSEIEEILLKVPFHLVPLRDDVPEAPEDEPTLEGNAIQKAAFYAKESGTYCLADDSGLEVDALGGDPGVLSARYAGPNCSPADNRNKLLEALRGVPALRRTARFRCVIALANGAGEVVATADGSLEGTIIDEERGERGFGYDSIFVPEGGTKTLAELTGEEKNAMSHRGRALRALRPRLLELL
jgi:XTP/dITP diphosphohydrolase